jgi:hypothetical protein
MDTADRPGRPAPATAGTLDAGDQTHQPDGAPAHQATEVPSQPGSANTEPATPAAQHGTSSVEPTARPANPVPARTVPAEATGRQADESRARREPGRLRRVIRGPVPRHLALLLSFIAAGAAVTWAPGPHRPLVGYLFGGYLPETRDTASYVWGFWWVAHQVTHLGNPWFTPLMAAPAGVDLGFHTLMPLPGLLFTPLTLAFGPAFSYNLMVAILPGLLCYATYRAARLWLRSATGAVAAGVFFGLSSMLTQQTWYHLNIAFGALFLPLALEASVRLRRSAAGTGGGRRRQAIILGLVMAAAALTDQESSILAAIVVALVLLPWLVRRPSWATLWPVLLAGAVGAVVATPQIVAMVQEIGVGGLSISQQLLAVSYKQYGIGLPGMFTPTPRVANFGLQALAGPFLHGRDNEGMPMFGTVLTVLAILGLIAARKRRSAWLLGVLWAGCAALALGTSLWIGKHQYLPLASVWNGVRVSDVMPYTWFVRLPGLSSFREADRLAILGLLPAALLAGAAVDWLRYHARPLIALVGVAALLEAGYGGSTAVGTMRTAYPQVDSKIAADHGNSIVVDIPFGLRGGIPVDGVPFFAKALVMATEDGHPRSIAYTSRVPDPTIDATNSHPFYAGLISVEHLIPRSCPYGVPGQADYLNNCPHPYGVVPRMTLPMDQDAYLSPADIAAARRDVAGMDIGWAVVWKRNTSISDFVRPYLLAVGFHFDYRSPAKGRDAVLVFKR